MKKILITGANGMLAGDFQKYTSQKYIIIACSKEELNICSFKNVQEIISLHTPDIVLNCAAYTAVDDAEDIGLKINFDTNTLGVIYLAQVCHEKNIDFITLSTDYIFDGLSKDGYNEYDIQNPLNNYGLAKYLSEKLSQQIYPHSIIVRTSWLYGGGKTYKNFVNTILTLSQSQQSIKIVDDQYGVPTYTGDLSQALYELIDTIENHRGKILHFSNSSEAGVTWADFAKEIFSLTQKETHIETCNSQEYFKKAQRPKYSILNNNSSIQLRNWKLGLSDYISRL